MASRPPLPRLRRTRTVGGGGMLPPLVPWRTVGIVVAVAIVIALLVWQVVPSVLSEDRESEVNAAIAQAEAQLTIAGSAENADAEREALRSALAQVERARSLDPDDPRIGQLEADAQARLETLDAITNVTELEQIVSFEGVITAPVEPEQLVVGGGALWLRESGQGRVFRLDASGQSEPVEVYRSGEVYGSVTAQSPTAIAWDASTGRLLVIDEARALFAVPSDASSPLEVPLRDASELQSVTDLAVYLGNLYILDPVAGEVWRYLPAGDGFDSERTGIIGGADIEDATGLEVDGEVFILDPPALRHFVQGREQEPMFQGIDELPESPVGLVEDVLREILYVADRSGGRILASERSGTFLRQYRHADFIDLRGLAVASDGTGIYALTTDGVSFFSVTSS